MSISLFKDGQRLYVTPEERIKLLQVAETLPPLERTLCETLANTGCRISEALSLHKGSIDVADKQVVIESLKKRKHGIFRAVPVSPSYIARMVATHGLERLSDSSAPLWPWHRTKAWQIVKTAFELAEIRGPWATPKGLRHAFAIYAIICDVPLHLIQRWMGHSSMKTTAIYLQAIGKEEREIAARMWPKEPVK